MLLIALHEWNNPQLDFSHRWFLENSCLFQRNRCLVPCSSSNVIILSKYIVIPCSYLFPIIYINCLMLCPLVVFYDRSSSIFSINIYAVPKKKPINFFLLKNYWTYVNRGENCRLGLT